MSSLDLGQLLKDISGLSVESIGADTARRVAERRMNDVGINKLSDYIALVLRSELEKQRLIDDVTVPETWFFRDHEPFLYLVQFVRSLSSWGGQTKPIRILSVPCATGEEPYSIAMVLLDAGFDKDRIKIEAVDISQRAIGKAQKGVFGSNSFRGKELFFRKKYFTEEAGQFYISETIKEMVHFSKKNILAPNFMQDREPFDLILCRNLLIYFDLKTKAKVLAVLHERMNDKSLLVLGHAETGRMAEGLFESVRQSGTFSYRKIVSGVRQENLIVPLDLTKKPLSSEFHKPAAYFHQDKPAIPVFKAKSRLEDKLSKQQTFQEIRVMADQGRLEEAIKACDAFIAETPDYAQGYYLRAVIFLALNNNEQAIEFFKKALYLDAKHYSALVQLSVLMEEQGDENQAETYRARAERLRAQGLDHHG